MIEDAVTQRPGPAAGREQSLLSLEAAESRFRSLIESAPDGVVIADGAGTIEFVNRQAEEMFGYAASELLGQPIDVLVPERLRAVHAQHRAVYADAPRLRPMAPDVDLYARRKDGSEFPVEIRLAPVQSEDGVLRVMSLVSDITERKEAENERKRTLRELEVAERRFHSLVESAPDAIIMVDDRGLIELVNRRAEETFGYAAAELLGQSVDLLVPERLRGLHTGHRRDYADAPRVRPMGSGLNLHARRKDGSEFPAEIRLAPMESDDGRLRVVSLITDVTETRRREEQLKRYTERLELLGEVQRAILAMRRPADIASTVIPRLRELLPVAAIGVVEIDPQTDELMVLGFESARPPHAMEPGARIGSSSLGNREALARGEVQFVPDLAAAPDLGPTLGAAIAAGLRSCTSVPLIAGGELTGMLSLFHSRAGQRLPDDLLEVKREVADRIAVALSEAHLRERLQRQTEELEERVHVRTLELEEANRELESFSYSVSHDLRAPLRAIDGFARIVADEAGPLLPEEQRRYLELINRNVRSMGMLIDGLLDFSRLGRLALSMRPIALDALVREAVDELAPLTRGERTRIEVGELPVVLGDRVLVKEVVVNLLSNAIKFSSRRDVPAIEVGALDEDEGDAVVFVRDNGVGFDMRYADKIFGVFQRLHRVEEYDGAGLGLALVGRIVKQHGGRVWAEAELDRGATFYFTLRRPEAA